MNYKFTLKVRSELDELIIKISSYSLESLEEQFNKIEKAIRDYEGKKEAEAEEEAERQAETEAERLELLKAEENYGIHKFR